MVRDKKKYDILVIEDNPGDFALIEEYLNQQMSLPKITHVENFKQVRLLFQTNKIIFDIILLDLSLPDKSGETLITEINSLCSGAPIVILTGYADIDFSIKSLSLGVADYLLKDDINATSLYKSIVFNVERRKASVALEESEKRYSDLFHLSPQPMWVYALNGFQFQDVNQAAINHYGYTREEFLGMKKDDICAKEDNMSAIEKPVALNDEANDMLDNCVMHQKKNGEVIRIELRSNTIEFQGKQSEIIIANDVTERFRYIQEIKDQNKKLNEIAWIQSHVVRAPLARILGLIDIITNHSTHANYNEELMGYLLGSAHELDKVIRDISDKTYTGQKGTG